jgi:hypothetical protein
MSAWPSGSGAARAFVPDLTPADRPELAALRPRLAFVAESPHVNEVAPERATERRPLCGMAGREWWGMLRELADGRRDDAVDLPSMLQFCLRHGVAVLNAVQYPLDPGVARKLAEADPHEVLEFSKAPGPRCYKKLGKEACVLGALESLRRRLAHPALAGARIHALGNDAEWFLKRALSAEDWAARYGGRIPHPSAWWRRGGWFRDRAREELGALLVPQRRATG